MTTYRDRLLPTLANSPPGAAVGAAVGVGVDAAAGAGAPDGSAPGLAAAQAPEPAGAGASAAAHVAEEPELGCESLEQWVTEVLAATYCRRVTGQFRWCAQWWRHAEAIVRLEALWRSWEALRVDPLLGMATWHRDYLDSQLPVLTGPTGPFADCQPDRHFEPEQPELPLMPAPEGWWTTDD